MELSILKECKKSSEHSLCCAQSLISVIRQAKKSLYLKKLTPTILNDIVNAVSVHAPDKSGGHRVQEVTISCNGIGILPANLLYDVMSGKAA